MNVLSLGFSIFIISAVCARTSALADSSPKITVFKCVSETGQLSFQKSPCAKTERAQQMQLVGDSQANRDAALLQAQAQATADREQAQQLEREQRYRAAALRAQAQQSPPIEAQEKPAVVCPPTFGDEVTMQAPTRTYYDASGRPQTVYQDMSMQYKFLPTKTYLKNAGRWPKECPQ